MKDDDHGQLLKRAGRSGRSWKGKAGSPDPREENMRDEKSHTLGATLAAAAGGASKDECICPIITKYVYLGVAISRG
jgi:hypothetical protein